MTIETYNIGDKVYDTKSNCISYIRKINVTITGNTDNDIIKDYLVSQTPE